MHQKRHFAELSKNWQLDPNNKINNWLTGLIQKFPQENKHMLEASWMLWTAELWSQKYQIPVINPTDRHVAKTISFL